MRVRMAKLDIRGGQRERTSRSRRGDRSSTSAIRTASVGPFSNCLFTISVCHRNQISILCSQSSDRNWFED